MKWQSFWDAFKSAIHNNAHLNAVDKINYMRSFLEGRARKVVEGFDLTEANYVNAIELLTQRFGQKKSVLTAHYKNLNCIPVSSNDTHSLRRTLDEICVHLRSLESAGDDTESTSMVVTIQSKFPPQVLRELEMGKDKEQMWTVTRLTEDSDNFISSGEIIDQSFRETPCSATEKKGFETSHRSRRLFSQNSYSHPSSNSTYQRSYKTTGQSLMSNEKENYLSRNVKKCRYCSRDHWSDECRTYSTIEARKKRI